MMLVCVDEDVLGPVRGRLLAHFAELALVLEGEVTLDCMDKLLLDSFHII